MSTPIKEINRMFKAGQCEAAWELAVEEWSENPGNIWEQRKMGWAVFHMMKHDAELHDFPLFIEHLNQFKSLDQLQMQFDTLIFEYLPWAIAAYPMDEQQCSVVFDTIRPMQFPPSDGYSYLLRVFLKHKGWPRLAEFIEWWNLDNLLGGDYRDFVLENGKSVMSLAEQVYIAYAKCLLQLRDKEKIRAFLPRMEALEDQYPDMIYPGYFVGKMLLFTGAEEERLLEEILPFVRRKSGEFWVWQLLADVYEPADEARLACLLRAVHCNPKEEFLGSVRTSLVKVYLGRGDYARAKHHLDIVVKTYLSNGWRLPSGLQDMINEPWVETVRPDVSAPIDFMSITDDIFLNELPEHTAVVVNVNPEKKTATIVYGLRKHVLAKTGRIGFKIQPGDFLIVRFDRIDDGKMNLLSARKSVGVANLEYCRTVSGTMDIKDGNAFGFIDNMFVSPSVVSKCKLQDGDSVTALAVMDYNKKKASWSWVIIKILSK